MGSTYTDFLCDFSTKYGFFLTVLNHGTFPLTPVHICDVDV